jgi:hypothetical protein
MCNVTLRRVHAAITVWKKQYYMFLARVCNLWYPACDAHLDNLDKICPYYLLLDIKCVF